MNKWKPFKLSSGEEIYTIELKKEEFSLIMKDSLNFIDISHQFSSDNSDSKVYILPNGNVLSSDDGYFTIFKNEKDLRELINDFSDSNGKEILLSLNPYDKDFGDHAEIIANDFLKNMSIRKGDNVEQLQEVDKFINNHLEYKSNKYLINYIAVIGNMILIKYGGTWEAELTSDKETWNPYLKIKGKRYDLITYVYEDVILSDKSNLLLSYQTISDIIEKNSKTVH